MGRVLDNALFDKRLAELGAWCNQVAGYQLEPGCTACYNERRRRIEAQVERMRAAYAWAPSPKAIGYDELDRLIAGLRSIAARLVRAMRHPVPALCAEHRAERPDGWCAACWPKERQRRLELQAEIDRHTVTADELFAQGLTSLAFDALSQRDVVTVRLERRDDRSCRHWHRNATEPQVGWVARPTRRPGGRYALDCPLCEQAANEAIEALRDEVREGALSPSDGKRLAEDCLRMECEHVRPLFHPAPRKVSPALDYPAPTVIPTVAEAAELLMSTDVLRLRQTLDALAMHLTQLDDEAQGGTPASSLGLEHHEHLAFERAARTVFSDGESEPSAYVEDITDAEIGAFVADEQDARAQVQKRYADFAGFAHLEGGAGDAIFDADVARSRFRFDELVRPFTVSTEDRYEVGGMADIIDRELRPKAEPEHAAWEREQLRTLQIRLRERLDLVLLWDERGRPDYEPTATLAALAVIADQPLLVSDGPSRFEAERFPDRTAYALRLAEDRLHTRHGLVRHARPESVPVMPDDLPMADEEVVF